VTTYIVDSGGLSQNLIIQSAPLLTFIQVTPQDRQHLESEVRKAHVICVVYSIDNPHSFDRIPTYWLPLFRQLGVNVGLPSPRASQFLTLFSGTCDPCRKQDRP
jgi:hypothetical protein